MKPAFRFAQESDSALILEFIRKLAEYESLLDQVVADEPLLREQLFEKQREAQFAAVAFYTLPAKTGTQHQQRKRGS